MTALARLPQLSRREIERIDRALKMAEPIRLEDYPGQDVFSPDVKWDSGIRRERD